MGGNSTVEGVLRGAIQLLLSIDEKAIEELNQRTDGSN